MYARRATDGVIVQLLGNAGRWVVFASVAVAMSWVLRLLAASAARAGSRRLGNARAALGLSREIPRRFVVKGRTDEPRTTGAKSLEHDTTNG
jgi:hypothetical protein